eukprot:CAMPEP_0194546460 /NCGR_PEP_ID=MMETSP0253-20130528/90692_1 /TAXON_ID=2966 /ORGANISM="Noctiluca scintillans" /LENGTH=37 /DNA_ID= /DNA_START= /DNA_END= /DNA_ORIENTATION=
MRCGQYPLEGLKWRKSQPVGRALHNLDGGNLDIQSGM